MSILILRSTPKGLSGSGLLGGRGERGSSELGSVVEVPFSALVVDGLHPEVTRATPVDKHAAAAPTMNERRSSSSLMADQLDHIARPSAFPLFSSQTC